MDDAFAQRTLAEWRETVGRALGCVGRGADAGRALPRPGGDGERLCRPHHDDERIPFALPTNPVQFDEQPVVPPGAPEHGQHTEEVLMDAGMEWDIIEKYKEAGAIL